MPDIAIAIDKDRLRDFCRRWKITEFALFGSAVRPVFATSAMPPIVPSITSPACRRS